MFYKILSLLPPKTWPSSQLAQTDAFFQLSFYSHQMCKSLESELSFDIMKISMDLEIRILPHSSRHTQSTKLFVIYSHRKTVWLFRDKIYLPLYVSKHEWNFLCPYLEILLESSLQRLQSTRPGASPGTCPGTSFGTLHGTIPGASPSTSPGTTLKLQVLVLSFALVSKPLLQENVCLF